VNDLVTPRVVRPPVGAVGNPVAVAVAIHAIGPTIAIAILISAILIAAIVVTSFHGVSDTAGKTSDDDQRYGKLFHIVLLAHKNVVY
jgi:hypothetical protein